MAYKIHRITRYSYSFDARTGGPSRLQLWSDQGMSADIRFAGDTGPVPPPTLSPDLESATMTLKSSALPGLVNMLRNTSHVSVTINDQGVVSIDSTYGLADSLVVCSSCAPDLLAAKTWGIQEAMRRLVSYCGSDALPEVCPITFHLDDDNYCGAYQPGITTGYFARDSSGFGQICLYDVEKVNRSLPFTVENAQKMEDQLLPVHEAMHAWFVGRQDSYRIQEPFCKLVSFVISELPGGPEYCDWFSSTPDGHADALMKYLCEMGITTQLAGQVLKRTAESAAHRGRALADAEFANVVTTVLGQDAVPAFQSAGILP